MVVIRMQRQRDLKCFREKEERVKKDNTTQQPYTVSRKQGQQRQIKMFWKG